MSNARHSSEDIEDTEVLTWSDEAEEPEVIPVRLMRSGITVITGRVTGKEYVFNGSGSIVGVDKRDIEIINRYNVVTASCCGSFSSPYFEFV